MIFDRVTIPLLQLPRCVPQGAACQGVPLARRAPRAFTMLEVLIAMGIFAVGFAAVAAIFPTAVLLQKKTVDDVVGQQVARNAQALLETRGLAEASLTTTLPAAWATDQKVYPLDESMLQVLPAGPDKWLLADRSYPSTTNPPDQRKMFWVPLVRDTNSAAGSLPTDITVYVFILQRETDATYDRPGTLVAADAGNLSDPTTVPLVARMAIANVDSANNRFDFAAGDNVNTLTGGGGTLIINVGDQILDAYGNIYTVTVADANGVKVAGFINPNLDNGLYADSLWYAHPDNTGRVRPTRRILTLTDAVQ